METDKLQIIETVMDQIRSLTTTNDLLLQIIDVLQFQDITTQQIEATKAIVSELDEEIGALSRGDRSTLQRSLAGSHRRLRPLPRGRRVRSGSRVRSPTSPTKTECCRSPL